MTRMMCRYCGEIFDKEEVSTPMKDKGWVWMKDSCPKCHKGMDDWYISDILWDMYSKEITLRAIRYNRRVKE